jgi:hypothetical protein
MKNGLSFNAALGFCKVWENRSKRDQNYINRNDNVTKPEKNHSMLLCNTIRFLGKGEEEVEENVIEGRQFKMRLINLCLFYAYKFITLLPAVSDSTACLQKKN